VVPARADTQADDVKADTRIRVLKSLNSDYPEADIIDSGKIEAVFVEDLNSLS